MLTLRRVAEALELEALTGQDRLDRAVTSGYASDLLSCAMNRAKAGCLWVTLQSHLNVVAVASLLGLSGVVLTEGSRPDQETLLKAESEGVALLATERSTFTVVARLAHLGLRGEPDGL